MSLPQHLRYGEGGTVTLDVRQLPTAVTYKIMDGDATVVQPDTADNVSISTINTTLVDMADRGAREIEVASNTGFAYGATAYIQDIPEEILVQAVEGTTIELSRPIMRDHISGANVHGATVSISVAANVANSLFWDGRAEINVDGERYYVAVECTRYPMQRLASEQDLFDMEPLLFDVLDVEEDSQRLLDQAHEYTLMQIAKAAPDKRARVFVGSMEFKNCTALAALYLHYRRRSSEEGQTLADRYHKDFLSALDAVTQTTPRDADQDQDIEAGETMSTRTVRLIRG